MLPSALRLAVLAACALPGCTLLLTYPGGESEVSFEACHDHLDQDFDGTTDCDDADCSTACDEAARCGDAIDDDMDGALDCVDEDCDGSPDCPEDEAITCVDGRDNDLDGRVDARDAGCWPHATLEVTRRCATVFGGSLAFDASTLYGGATVVDPAGLAGSWVSVAAARVDPRGQIAPAVVASVPAAGALEGTRATARLAATVDGAPTLPLMALALVTPSGDRGTGALVELALASLPPSGRPGLLLLGDVVLGTPAAISPPDPAQPLDFEIELVDGVAHGRVRTATGSLLAEVQAALAPDWDDALGLARPLLLGVGALDSGQRAWVESATIARSTLPRCETVQPPIGVALATDVPRMDSAVNTVVRGDGAMLCALATSRGRASPETRSVRSDDDGLHWTAGDDLLAPLAVSGSASAEMGALARDPVTGAWHAAFLHGGRLLVAESNDCLAWSSLAVAIEDLSEGDRYRLVDISAPLYYRATPAGHEIAWHVAEDGESLVRFVVSPWGDPGTWNVSDTTDHGLSAIFGPFDPPPNVTTMDRTTVQAFGARVLVEEGGRALHVETRDGWSTLSVPAYSAPGEAGTFDARELIGTATFLEDVESSDAPREWRGRLFYSGLSDLSPDSGWGWVELAVRPAL